MKRLRLKCDASNPSVIVDEITGKRPVLVRGESYQLEIGLFSGGEMASSEPDRVTTITINDGTQSYDLSAIAETGTLTAAQWHAGSAAHYTIIADDSYTYFLTAGSGTLFVTSTRTGEGQVAWAACRIDIIDLGVATTIPINIPSSPQVYTKTQTDAKYALATGLTAANASITALQTDATATVRHTAQTLTGPQKAQARTNIGAAAAGASETSITSNDLPLDTATSWWHQLTANTTLTASGTPIIGQIYQIVLAQDATGNRTIAFPGVVDPGAIINPTPSTQTAFRLDVRRTNGTTGTEIRVSPYDATVTPPDPTWEMNFGRRNRTTVVSNAVTEISDTYAGNTWELVAGATAPALTTINNRSAVSFSATGYKVKTTPTAALAAGAAGLTVIAVFSTASTADQRIMHAGPLGLSLDVRGGNVEFGNEGNSGQRVAVAYSSSGDATLVIATFTPGSPASALLYVAKHGGGASSKYSASATAGSANGNWEVGQTSGGTTRFAGKLAILRVLDKPLTWAQVQDAARTLTAEFGIVT